VQGASYSAGAPIAPGTLITIYGNNLADQTGQTSGVPLPQQINGTQLLLGSEAAPLLYASSGQINIQVPYDLPVNSQFQMTVQRGGALSVPEALVVASAQPGIFTTNVQGTGQGVILRGDQTTLAQPGTPATAGETVVIYCTGLGAVSPAVTAGQAAPSSPISQTVNTVTVTIGGVPANVQFAGLTPGFAGLYQINAVVPAGVSGPQLPVVISVAGQSSPAAVTMAVN
jgi:adhesin/invasin